jgi:hypothetical protein
MWSSEGIFDLRMGDRELQIGQIIDNALLETNPRSPIAKR